METATMIRGKSMNRAQKIAWSVVVATVMAFVVSLIAVGVAYRYVGMPKALLGFSFMGLVGLAGLGPLVFRKEDGPVTADERDQLFGRRAALAGFAAAYTVVGAACMVPFFVLGPDARISIAWLPQIFIGAGIAHFFVHAIAILHQYGWTDAEVRRG